MALKFVVKKAITLPIRKIAINEPAYLKVTEPMFTGKKLEDDKEACTILNVVDLETGESCQVVVPTVLKGILEDNYPEDSYVGINFQITKGKMPSGRKYHPFSVCEVTIEDDGE